MKSIFNTISDHLWSFVVITGLKLMLINRVRFLFVYDKFVFLIKLLRVCHVILEEVISVGQDVAGPLMKVKGSVPLDWVRN